MTKVRIKNENENCIGKMYSLMLCQTGIAKEVCRCLLKGE